MKTIVARIEDEFQLPRVFREVCICSRSSVSQEIHINLSFTLVKIDLWLLIALKVFLSLHREKLNFQNVYQSSDLFFS